MFKLTGKFKAYVGKNKMQQRKENKNTQWIHSKLDISFPVQVKLF